MGVQNWAGRESAPNPRMARAQWVDLCGTWDFRHDDANEGLAQGWGAGAAEFDLKITVPYPPESRASGLSAREFHPVIWYRRRVAAPALAGGERLILNFGAVDYAATVWVNGQVVAMHEGGHTPFSADVTDVLVAGEQTIVVRAADPSSDARIPRGKQDWREKAHEIWYDRTSGIWQPVWFAVVPAVHITDLAFTTDISNARVRCEIRLNKAPAAPTALRVRLTGAEDLADVTVMVGDSEAEFDIAIPALRQGVDRGRFLWTPGNPVLIDATVELGDDRIESYLGLRSVRSGHGRFMLNERPLFLRLVLGQNYWPDSHLAASAAELRAEVELIKAMGFNGVRIHQKIEDPRFLHWCDRLGLLVWEEMPSAYSFASSTVERLTAEWAQVIRRDKGHPCIVAWVPLNESWGVTDIARRPDQQAWARALYHLTKALDPSRLAISNDGWELVDSDIVSIHDYAPDGEGLERLYGTAEALKGVLDGFAGPGRLMMLDGEGAGDRPVMLTEFGGLSFMPKAGADWHGYATVPDAKALEERLEGLFAAITDHPHLVGFCYTQATDTMQEVNGLLTEDRKPKLPFEVLERIIARPSVAFPQERVDAERKRARKAAERAEKKKKG